MPTTGQAPTKSKPSRFPECWDRISRAESNGESIGTDWGQLTQQDIYSQFTKDNGDGTVSLMIKGQPLPPILSLKLGEVLYQLRAALDGLIYQAILLDEGGSITTKDYLGFPVCESEAAFKSNTNSSKLGKLADERKAIVESVQPYKSPSPRDTGLWMLNDLAKRDRHRRPHVVACWIRDIEVKVTPKPKRVIKVIGSGYLEDELELATVEPRDEDVRKDFHANVVTPADIGIDGISGGRLAEIINSMSDAVSDVVIRFEDSF